MMQHHRIMYECGFVQQEMLPAMHSMAFGYEV
jgi:hypothetical protein